MGRANVPTLHQYRDIGDPIDEPPFRPRTVAKDPERILAAIFLKLNRTYGEGPFDASHVLQYLLAPEETGPAVKTRKGRNTAPLFREQAPAHVDDESGWHPDNSADQAVANGRPRASGHSAVEETNPRAQDQHAHKGLVVDLLNPVKAPLARARNVGPRRIL
jgi:hypothetical protein